MNGGTEHHFDVMPYKLPGQSHASIYEACTLTNEDSSLSVILDQFQPQTSNRNVNSTF